MIVELTDNGLKYNWHASGPQGARFEIFAHNGHSNAQVEEAKAQLKREQDVVKIYVTYLTKEKWDKLKLFLHPIAIINDELNAQLNAQK